jgi:YVTN family beta-propeller protein
MTSLAFLRILLLAPIVALTVRPTAAQHYRLLQKVEITPGAGIFDYAATDSTNRRVYLSHGEELVVLDADSNAVAGKIPAPPFDPSYGIGIAGRVTPYMGVHHAAFAPELGRGFTANGRARTSTIFDLKTLAPLGEVKIAGRDPNAVIYDAATKRVFVFNEESDNVTVFDAVSREVLKTIELGGHPAFAASDDRGHLFVNIIDKNIVQRIDSRNLTLLERWAAGCTGPHNETMAIDNRNGRLFIGCRPDARRLMFPPGPRPDRIMTVLDTNDGRVITSVPIGGNPDQAAFDPDAGLVFSANGEGSVTVIRQESPETYSVVQTVMTESGATRLTVDPKTHKIFVPNNDTYTSGRGQAFWALILGM